MGRGCPEACLFPLQLFSPGAHEMWEIIAYKSAGEPCVQSEVCIMQIPVWAGVFTS
jgi:hypothetical protein